MNGLRILKSEVGIYQLLYEKAKAGKAPGPDNINVEPTSTKSTDLFNKIYDTG